MMENQIEKNVEHLLETALGVVWVYQPVVMPGL